MNNQPTKIADATAFIENDFPVHIDMEDAIPIVAPVTVVLGIDGVIQTGVVIEPVVGAETIDFVLTSTLLKTFQVGKKKYTVYIKFADSFIFSMPVTPTMDGAVTSPRLAIPVTTPSIGTVRTSVYGDITESVALGKITGLESVIYQGTDIRKIFDLPGINYTGWLTGTGFYGWAFGYIPLKLEKFVYIELSLSNVNLNNFIRFRIIKRLIANKNSTTSPGGITASDVTMVTMVLPKSNFADTADRQKIRFEPNTPLDFDTDHVYCFVVEGIMVESPTSRNLLGTDAAPIASGILSQAEVGWVFSSSTGNASALAIGSSYTMERAIFTEVQVNQFDNLNDKIVENKDAIIETQASVDAITNNLGALLGGNGTVLFSDPLSSISAPLIHNSSWVVVAGGISPNTTGLIDSCLRLNLEYGLAHRKMSVLAKLGADTRFILYTRPQGGAGYSTIVEIEGSVGKVGANPAVPGKLRIYNQYHSGAVLPTVLMEKDYTFTPGREYLVELIKDHFENAIRVTDTVSGFSDELRDVTGASGRQWDDYCIANYSGTAPVVREMRVWTPVKKGCLLLIMGDSITEGRYTPLANGDCYAQKALARVGNNGGWSGRGGATITSVNRRILSEVAIIKPQNLFITIGTNDGNTVANLTALCNQVTTLGTQIWLNNIPRKSRPASDPVADSIANGYINTVRANLGLKGCRYDLATSLNNNYADGIDINLYNLDKENSGTTDLYIHPKVNGMIEMDKRHAIDMRELIES